MGVWRRGAAFLLDEWLLSLSAGALLVTSLYLHRWPVYSWGELEPIFLLFALFVAVRGIERSALLLRIASYLERGRWLAPRLVVISYLLSIVMSIDVTLVTLLPLVLAMRVANRDALVLLVAFTAHVGAALTPFGTPQNLFIFSYYHLRIAPFIQEIAPFSILLFGLFLLLSLFVPVSQGMLQERSRERIDPRQALIYLLLLGVTVLAVVRLLPWYAAAATLLYALLFDRRSLEVDYPLLATFVIFLGLANQMRTILAPELSHPVHLFMLSSVLSQAISNVPATLLLHQFTPHWQALLWGTNVGSFGTPVAALANLITWRIYAAHESSQRSSAFVWQMVWWGMLVYGAGVLLYIFVGTA